MGSTQWIALGAIGTLLVVLFNLVVIFFLPWWRRPKFSIEFHAKEPFCREAKSSQFASSLHTLPTYWVRLRVRNSGRSVARRCLAKLVRVMDENGLQKEEYDPMQLHWVITDWGEVPFRAIDLDRDDYEYLDILVTQEGSHDVFLAGDQFPWANYQPRAIPYTLPPSKHIVGITVYGDDVKPKTKYTSLIWVGDKIKNIYVEVHDNPRDAKSWFKKWLKKTPRV